MEDMTPKEVFTRVKPEVIHLRIFSNQVYVHIPSEKRTKLEPSSEKGIFVGHSETSKAYRVYIPRQRKIAVSRDVIFKEGGTFKRSHDTKPVVVEDWERWALNVEQGPTTPTSGTQPSD
jgi:hypothetical protein